MKAAVKHLMLADPVLASIIERVGPCVLQKRDITFETLARSVAYQQLHGKAAAAIFARLKRAAGRRFTANAFLRLTQDELRACGLSRQKIACITDLANHTRDRKIAFHRLHALTEDEIIERLCCVRGIGIWTVQMFMIFALERPDVLPGSDFGVRNAVRKAYGLEQLPTAKELAAIAEPWRPFRSIASWYLWRSLDGNAEL